MHHLHPYTRHWFSAVALTFLIWGCIVVDDFGKYWDKGFVDSCVNEIVLSSMDEESSSQSQLAMRSLLIDGHTFLMVRDHKNDKGGNLIRYEIEGSDYVSYRLNDQEREHFLKYYPDSSVVLTPETVTIPVLNEDSVALLARIVKDKDYWLENSREPYNPTHRNDCIKTSQEKL